MADQTAQYIFMHKDIPVAEFGLDSVTGTIVSIGQVYKPRHVPVGIPVRKGSADRGALNEWWRGRSIPASRSGIREALRELRISDSRILAEKCLGLSLSDQAAQGKGFADSTRFDVTEDRAYSGEVQA